MSSDPEAHFPDDYRAARRAFIAAVEATGADVITRAHPTARAADGKPLFLDSAALGPRGAARALLLLSRGPAGSAALTALLQGGIATALPAGARLVAVHALDLFGLAGADTQWPQAMLHAIATEDLSRVEKLTVLDLDGGAVPDLARALPGAAIAGRTLPPGASPDTVFPAVQAALAGL